MFEAKGEEVMGIGVKDAGSFGPIKVNEFRVLVGFCVECV